MARSKFPGKPSKQMNKRRVNVLAATLDATTQEEEDGDEGAQNGKAEPPAVAATTTTVKRTRKRKLLRDLVETRRRSFSKQRHLIGDAATKGMRKARSVGRPGRSNGASRAEQPRPAKIRKMRTVTQPLGENANLVGKFVLPSRSVHSSRVIKPNKRFINVEAINTIESLTFRKRVVSKRANALKVDKSEAKTTAHACKPSSHDANRTAACGEVAPKGAPTESADLLGRNCTNRRIVLRQARLQLHSQPATGAEGPFSASGATTSAGSGSPPGTVTCGVCGAVRFYRFVKQARKFHIYSCESCRKFISKMIKRQLCNDKASSSVAQPLSCLKGQGMCHVPPIVRSQQWKLFRCAYRARCPACWLKMCLRSFQMPPNLKQNLAELLPDFMRGHETTLFNNLSLFSFHTNTGVEGKGGLLGKEATRTDTLTRQRLAQRVTPPVKPFTTPTSDIKRQKVDLKGPRVKHVCRSASIVLGQPLATFTVADGEQRKPAEHVDVAEKHAPALKVASKIAPVVAVVPAVAATDVVDRQCDKDDVTNAIESKKRAAAVIESEILGQRDMLKLDLIDEPDRTEEMALAVELQSRTVPKENTISLDFWENYELEEVSQNGFGLIADESFPLRGICFLCGSAGREPLLYCCMCCEPYHLFCLDQIPNNLTAFDWVCPKCTGCSRCGQFERYKIHCHKCQKPYHPECLNNQTDGTDQRMICSECMRCKGCGSDDVTKFMGNLPLCLMCFKMRKRENYCPLCKGSYDDNELQLKMLECVKCNRWIHAKCESVTNEEYQLISLLPESVGFTCCVCETSPQWRKAIVSQLRSNFNYILRRLNKNRLAREALNRCNALNKYEMNDVVGNAELNNNLARSHDNKGKTRMHMKSVVENERFDHESLSSASSVYNIKTKLISNEYSSVSQFNKSMHDVMDCNNSKELMRLYEDILKQIFPWYDPCETYTHASVATKERTHDDAATRARADLVQIEQLQATCDARACVLCNGIGDGHVEGESRLLYCGRNVWIHGNCALWSNDVYEEIDGSLHNVHHVIEAAKVRACVYCHRSGASVACCAKSCANVYHFVCAQHAQCHFLQDKTFYCATHLHCTSSATRASEFALRRLLYVELDRKQSTHTNPDNVNVMIGSLVVTKLGKLLSISDYSDAVIPIGFRCERLFWSTTEPWKLIPYVISTSVLHPQCTSIYLDRHFTVDHALPRCALDRKLREITCWQRELDRDVSLSSFSDFDDDEEEEEEDDDDDGERQSENAAPDILSPELTDAILKEFPHEFLDRISMQDIFPKLLNNEDLVALDALDAKSNEYSNSSENSLNRIGRYDLDKTYLDLDDEPPLRKTKPATFGKEKCVKCPLSAHETTATPTTVKRRRMSRDKNMFLKYVQLDGAYDSSSGSECESDMMLQLTDQPVKCDRCQCTYRTQASYSRHLESCEVLSTSDSDTELIHDHQQHSPLLVNFTPTIKISEDGIATFEKNYESSYTTSTYETEVRTSLNTQTETYMNGESEIIVAQSAESLYANFAPLIDDEILIDSFNLNPSAAHAAQLNPTHAQSQLELPPANQQPIYNNVDASPLDPHQTLSIDHQLPTTNQHLPRICVHTPTTAFLNSPATNHYVQSSPVPMHHHQHQSSAIALNQPISIHAATTAHAQQQPTTTINNPLLTVAVDNNKMPTSASVVMATPTFATPTASPLFKTPPAKVVRAPRPRPKPLTAKRAAAQHKVGFERALFLTPNHGAVTTTTTPLVMQPLPASNVLPATFLDALHAQSNPNVQYVATLNPQIQIAAHHHQATPLLHLQSDSTTGLLNLVPSVQSTLLLQQQPRVLGEPLLVDGGSLVWTTQPVQPVFYGFETIVHNTVMQSHQQFVPGTMPGMLTANSSYSSTTQVFQTSKLEPILDVTSGNIVLVNSGTVVSPSTTTTAPAQQQHQQQSVATPITVLPTSVHHTKPNTNWRHVESGDAPMVCQARAALSLSQRQSPVSIANAQLRTSQPLAPTRLATFPTVAVPLPAVSSMATSTPNSSSSIISLPVAPFAVDPCLPTNIVTPTIQSRPMSRVLPMPNASNPVKVKQPHKSLIIDIKSQQQQQQPLPKPLGKANHHHHHVSNEKILILDDIIVKPVLEEASNLKLHADVDRELKQIIEREVEEGLYKHNSYKTAPPIAPLRYSNGKQPCMPSLTNPLVQRFSTPSPPNIAHAHAKPKQLSPPPVTLPPLSARPAPAARPPPNPACAPAYTSFRSAFPPPPPPQNHAIRPAVAPLRPAAISPHSMPNNIAYSCASASPLDSPLTTPPSVLRCPTPPAPPSTLLKADAQQRAQREDKENAILYTVETKDGFRYSSTSLIELWTKIFESVQAARVANNMQPLPAQMIGSLSLLGLKSNALTYLLEQLPGIGKCVKYKPRYRGAGRAHAHPGADADDDNDFDYHPGSAARCRAYQRTTEPNDLFAWLTSKQRKPPNRVPANLELITKRSAITSLPMAIRFRHLKATWKRSVGVYSSRIHKRGLFCLRDIENGEMVIEYTGEVIRSIVVDKREKEYQAKDLGCYMFKIDENFVVDATRMGNAARFINHSCDPNCYSKVIDLQGRKHIIIFANRKITRGEELTYDYQFPLEDDKIPCSCGTTRCRKFLN